MKVRALMLIASLLACGPLNAQWDSIVGESSVIEGFDRYWVTVRSGNTVYLVDTKNGEVAGTIATSRFSPAVAPHPESGRIFSYGSFYTRDIRGERTDLVMSWDLATLTPGEEVEIPARASAIGTTASGLMGMMQRRFVGVWNISPASSVSVVDTEDMRFVGEISLPSCSGVNPLADGWLSVCGDGTAHFVALDENGEEAGRVRSEPFFDQTVDPVYDYAVPAADGYMYLSFEGLLRKVTLEGDQIVISDAFDINPENDGIPDVNGFVPSNDDHFRIGGLQPFAWHDEEALLFTLMHAGGGQHTYEQAGTELWGFNMRTGNRGYRIELGDGITARSVFVTPGPEPLLLLATSNGLQVREPRTGRLIRTMDWVTGQTIQALYEGWSFEDLADD